MSREDLGLDPTELRLLVEKSAARVALHALVVTATWLGLAALARSCDALAPKLVLYALSGFFVNGLVQLAHESWHHNLFESRRANVMAGYALGLLVGCAYEPLRHGHLAHHRHVRTERDPDAYNAGARTPLLYVQFYVIVLFGLVLSPLHFNLLYPLRYFDRAAWRAHLRVLGLYALFYAALFGALGRFGLLGAARDLWLFPVLAASPWNGLKSIADHHANAWKGSRFATATTVTSHALVTFFWHGLNHHLDHHLYPRVPGHRLARLHARLAPALRARRSPVFASYAKVMLAAFVAGPTTVAASEAPRGPVDLRAPRRGAGRSAP